MTEPREPSNELDLSQRPSGIPPDQKSIVLMHEIDDWISHVWMVRTFLKHSDEASDDDELAEVHRGLYDFMLALGPSLEAGDAVRYLRIANKKISKLRATAAAFRELQPEVSGHMNFRMANRSLTLAVERIDALLQGNS
ncbi:MAG: amidohydrolase [Pirellula sp.]